MATPRNWPRVITYVSGAVLFLLLLQYFLGLWTNVYAPAQFASFDSGANYAPSLNAHIINGDVLFLLAVVLLVLAAFSRQARLVISAVVLVVAVYAAGEFGMAYVNSSPNDPIDSFGMGSLFLVALFSAAGLMMMSWRSPPSLVPKSETPASGPQAG